jgi:hypothetical protein
MVDQVGGKVVITSVADDTGIKKTQEGLKATEKQAQSTNTALVAGSKAAQKEIRRAAEQAEGETKAAFNRRRLAEERSAASARKISLAGSAQIVADQKRVLQALQREQRESGQKILQDTQKTSDQAVEIEKQNSRKVEVVRKASSRRAAEQTRADNAVREIAAAQSQNKETEIVRKASSKRSTVRKVEISDAEKQLALKATERTAAAAPPGGRPPPPPGGRPPPPPPPPPPGGGEPPDDSRPRRRLTNSERDARREAKKASKISADELKAVQKASNDELAQLARQGGEKQRAAENEQRKRARAERSQELREVADSERQSRILRAEGIRHFAIYAHMMGYRLPRIQFLVPAFELFYRRFGSLTGVMGNATKSTLSWIGMGQKAIATVLKMGTGAGFAAAGIAGLTYAMTKAATLSKDWDVSQTRLGITLRKTTMAGKEGIEDLQRRASDLSHTIGVPIDEARAAITNLFEARPRGDELEKAQNLLQRFIASTGMGAVDASKLFREAMNGNEQAALDLVKTIRGELSPATKLLFDAAAGTKIPGPLRHRLFEELGSDLPKDAVEQVQRVEGALGRQERAWNDTRTAMSTFMKEFGRASRLLDEPLMERGSKSMESFAKFIDAATEKLKGFDDYWNSRSLKPGPIAPSGVVPDEYYGMKGTYDPSRNRPTSNQPMSSQEKEFYTRGAGPNVVVPQTESLLQRWRRQDQERQASPEYKAEQRRRQEYYDPSANRPGTSVGTSPTVSSGFMKWLYENFSKGMGGMPSQPWMVPPVHRQAGGRLGARQPAILGERGPEIFIPSMSGIVHPFPEQSSQSGSLSPLVMQTTFSMLRRFAGELSAATGSVQTFGNTVDVVAMRMNSILRDMGARHKGDLGGGGGGGDGGDGGDGEGGAAPRNLSGAGPPGKFTPADSPNFQPPKSLGGAGSPGRFEPSDSPNFQPPKSLSGAGPFTAPPKINRDASLTGMGNYKGKDKFTLAPAQGTDVQKAVGVSGAEWAAYRYGLASIESGGKYGIMGGSSNRFAGAYQMGGAEISETARRLGEPVPSRQQFLSDSAMQERFINSYTAQHHEYLMKNSSVYRNLSPQKKLEVLGYAHNQGAGGASQWLRTGVAGRDAFQTSGTAYPRAIEARLNALNAQRPVAPPALPPPPSPIPSPRDVAPPALPPPPSTIPSPRDVASPAHSPPTRIIIPPAPKMNTERAVPVPQPKTAAAIPGKEDTTQLGRGSVDINLTLPPYLMASKPAIRQPDRFHVSTTINRDTTGRPRGLSRPGDPSIPVGV